MADVFGAQLGIQFRSQAIDLDPKALEVGATPFLPGRLPQRTAGVTVDGSKNKAYERSRRMATADKDRRPWAFRPGDGFESAPAHARIRHGGRTIVYASSHTLAYAPIPSK